MWTKVKEYYGAVIVWLDDHPTAAFWIIVALAVLNLVR
jgi:hypothetical protein